MFQLNKEDLENFLYKTQKDLNDKVFNNVYNFLRENPRARKTLNPAFPFPQKVRLGILNNYFAVEYIGPNKDDEDGFETTILYDPRIDLYEFLEIDLSHLRLNKIPYSESFENMNMFFGESIDYLTDYFYDFTQWKENFSLNGLIDISVSNKPVVLNNCSFFWTDSVGGLKIRHIDLLELFPYEDGNLVYHSDESFTYFSNYIVQNPVPIYDVEIHKTLNKFIELINLKDTTEPNITDYLANNPKILQIAFGIYDLNPQIDLIWQYNPNLRKNLKPDFLPKRMDGFCDIMEFKLPNLKSAPIVGSDNRREPSHEIDKAIAQVDEYDEWFEQQNNRDWLLKEKGINIHKPVRYIIMGHSKDFLPEDRQRLRNKRNTIFFTYDEFIEAARYQIYRIR